MNTFKWLKDFICTMNKSTCYYCMEYIFLFCFIILYKMNKLNKNCPKDIDLTDTFRNCFTTILMFFVELFVLTRQMFLDLMIRLIF